MRELRLNCIRLYCWAQLAELQLEILALRDAWLTDEAAREIARITTLQDLDITDHFLTCEGLSYLSTLPLLHTLRDGTPPPFGATELKHFAHLTTLEWGRAGQALLTVLPMMRLEALILLNCSLIPPTGWATFARQKTSLRRLSVRKCEVPIDDLQRLLPGVEVSEL